MAIVEIDTENKTAIKCKEICFQNNSFSSFILRTRGTRKIGCSKKIWNIPPETRRM